MPKYDLKCPRCGKKVYMECPYQFAKEKLCPRCGTLMQIHIKPGYIRIKWKTIKID